MGLFLLILTLFIICFTFYDMSIFNVSKWKKFNDGEMEILFSRDIYEPTRIRATGKGIRKSLKKHYNDLKKIKIIN